MKNVFIIADDTTGANASAILNKPLGYDCISVRTEVKEIKPNSVYSFGTSSRGIAKDEAYKVVKETLINLKDKSAIYNKRVDSTLRGNLGSELDAFLDYFPNKTAIVVASFPSSGRTCVNNTLFVNGELLENTDVAKDPKCPVTTSFVTDLFKKQTKKTMDKINLSDVKSKDFPKILKQKYDNNRIVVIDASENEDIDHIAKTCVDLDLDIITVDPGPFTYYYAKNHKLKENYMFYCLIGSVTPLTLEQMKYAKNYGAYVYELDCKKILSEEHVRYLEESYEDLINISNDFIIITTSNLCGNYKIDLSKYSHISDSVEEISNLINSRIADLFIKFLNTKHPDCVYTSGGDTTVEFLKQIQSNALRMNHQILPLTVESTILRGSFEGMKIVSKGGLIGDQSSLIQIYNFMRVGSK